MTMVIPVERVKAKENHCTMPSVITQVEGKFNT
jgi:hypothetical protein